MKTLPKAAIVIACAFAPAMSPAATVTQFGFEAGYVDDQEIAADGTALIDDTGVASSFVSLSTPGANTMSVEASGDDALDGFWFDSASPTQFDEESPRETVSSLGAFFLRTTVGLGGAFVTTGPVFSLAFDGGASAVSGELWDIDGSRGRTEAWRVVANRAGRAPAEALSPVGTSNDDRTSLDGQAWRFSFAEAGNDITSLDFYFTGSKTSNVGAAFDNLTVTQLPAPVPLPAAFWMLGAALGGLVAARRARARPRITRTS